MATPPSSPKHLMVAMRNCKISTTAAPQDTRPPTACEKVLHTVELLDAILSHITARRASHDSSILRGILRLSRVNKAFYNHIHGDTLIAQELFLTPNARNNKVTCVLQEFELERRNAFRLGCLRCVDLGLDSPILRHISFHISCSQLRRKVQSGKMQSWREMFLPVAEVKLHPQPTTS